MRHVELAAHYLARINAQHRVVELRPIEKLRRAALLYYNVRVIDARQKSESRTTEHDFARTGSEINPLAAHFRCELAKLFAVCRVEEDLEDYIREPSVR